MPDEFGQQEWVAQTRDALQTVGNVSRDGLLRLTSSDELDLDRPHATGGWFGEFRLPPDTVLVRLGDLSVERQRVRDALNRATSRAGVVAASVLAGVTASPEEILRQRGWLSRGRTYQVARLSEFVDRGFLVGFTHQRPHASVFFPGDTVTDVSEHHIDRFVEVWQAARRVD